VDPDYRLDFVRANRSMPRSLVIPELVYPDVREAVTWLCDTFGFSERWVAGDHRAQLAVGDAAVVVMAADGGDRKRRQHPAQHGNRRSSTASIVEAPLSTPDEPGAAPRTPASPQPPSLGLHTYWLRADRARTARR
jgi:hypothetical protein